MVQSSTVVEFKIVEDVGNIQLKNIVKVLNILKNKRFDLILWISFSIPIFGEKNFPRFFFQWYRKFPYQIS